MAVHESNDVVSATGFKKEIDAAGLTMVMDNLQVYQYQYPQKSTIREVTSNAKDAVKEKRIAEKILKKEATPEDFYIYREDDVYKSSNFDESYFDLDWLDLESDKVEIEHKYSEDVNSKDILTIRDNGVGLGGKRLEGYFKLSWSSKRNSKDALGKFGIGAKAPLSLGINSYRMISYYNGVKYTFDVYAHKVDSVIPKFNLTTGELNVPYTFENGYVAYGEVTTHKNGTEIIIETKKHHRTLYVDAVKSQLLHFENVSFTIINEHGYRSLVDVQADILYEDEYIVLSNNTQFSKPYLLIGNKGSMVSYGYVDFQELELENKVGNIGIKVSSEEVTVNPSRESVIWDERTRETIVNRFKKVVSIATEYVSNSLKETDFIKWMDSCCATLMGHSSDPILSRFARVVDKSELTPRYPEDSSITFGRPDKFFGSLTVRSISRVNKGVDRSVFNSWLNFNGDAVYVTKGKASLRKDLYLLENLKTNSGYGHVYNSCLTLITLPDTTEDEALLKSFDITKPEQLATRSRVKAAMVKRDKILSKLMESSKVLDYDAIEVPETFMKEVPNGEVDTFVNEIPTESDAERRRREEKILLTRPVSLNLRNLVWADKSFDWTRSELRVSHLEDTKIDYVYGFQEDDEMLHFAVNMLDAAGHRADGWLDNAELRVVKIAKSIKKHFKTGIHVRDFLFNIKDNKLSMHSSLVKWNTGRIISKHLYSLRFLVNFECFNKEMFDMYNEVYEYHHNVFSTPLNSTPHKGYGMNRDTFDEFVVMADRMTELQLFIEDNSDDAEAIAAKSKNLFNTEVGEVAGIEMDMYKKLTTLLDYAESISTLLNSLQPLYTKGAHISEELETEIKAYLTLKGAEITG
jgi:transposase-like protein